MEPAEEAPRGKAGATSIPSGSPRNLWGPECHPRALELQNQDGITHTEVKDQGRTLQLSHHGTKPRHLGKGIWAQTGKYVDKY